MSIRQTTTRAHGPAHASQPAHVHSQSQTSPAHFDVIIIGGGINGAGIARDCALRGLKTLIVDKNDFAYGTSSRSTKLVHGGIRYLEHAQFRLVWEACHERKTLTQIAPHLVRAIPFIIPVYKGDKRPAWLVKLGMFLYDLMAGFKNIRRHKNLSARQIAEIMPDLKREGLKGGGIYYDCQTNDARLTLANIQDAVRHGATAKNYTEVATIKAHENGLEVVCQDVLTAEKFTFTTSYIVNATGPWLDINLAKWHLDNVKHLRLTKGIHFFIPRGGAGVPRGAEGVSRAQQVVPIGAAGGILPEDYALLIGAQRDERVFFVIPHGDFSLVGTTDTDYKGDPDKVHVTQEDIQYLLDELRRLFPKLKIAPKDVTGEYAGLRPLLKTEGVKAGAVTREYQLKETRRGDSVILSVIGGKLTTYRSLAEKVTDRIIKTLKARESKNTMGLNKPKKWHKSLHVQTFAKFMPGHELQIACKYSRTAKLRLPGSEFPQKTFEEFKRRLLEDNLDLIHLPHDIAENLIQTYGSEINNFLPYLQQGSGPDTKPDAAAATGAAPAPTQRIIPEAPFIWAQLYYGIDHEFVRTAEDFIRRRTELYLHLKNHQALSQEITEYLHGETLNNPSGN